MVIRFWNIKDLGNVMYSAGGSQFKQELLFPNVTDFRNKFEVLEDGVVKDGKFIAKETISSKLYNVKVQIPDYIAEVLNTLRQHDHVEVEFSTGNGDTYDRIGTAEDVSFNVDRYLNGGLMEVTITFIFEYVVKNNIDSNFTRNMT